MADALLSRPASKISAEYAALLARARVAPSTPAALLARTAGAFDRGGGLSPAATRSMGSDDVSRYAVSSGGHGWPFWTNWMAVLGWAWIREQGG
jgi:hypothetical protein